MKKQPILKIDDLNIYFSNNEKGSKNKKIKAITDLNLELYEGEILAIVGASGSGKSLLAHSILGILPKNTTIEGSIIFDNKVINEKDKKKLRGKEIVIIPQSTTYLDPLMKVGKQVKISIKDKKNASKLQRDIFSKYGLSKQVDGLYPFELSGGMARRVLLSTAIAAKSKVIIADEPTPGLDEKNLMETLKNFREIADDNNAILMITHDIEAAIKIADKIAVFYAGTILEIANATDFSENGEKLRHPYTKALYRALPQNGFEPIEGSQPLSHQLPYGCLFYDRCKNSNSRCKDDRPGIKYLRNGLVRCINAT